MNIRRFNVDGTPRIGVFNDKTITGITYSVYGFAQLLEQAIDGRELPTQGGIFQNLDWFSAKAMQHMSPVGPYVVTSDEISNPQDLRIGSRLNGDVMQDERTALMIRSSAELVSFVSTRVRFEPGDIIATGTIEGMGGLQHIRFGDSDEIKISIDEIKTMNNIIEAVD